MCAFDGLEGGDYDGGQTFHWTSTTAPTRMEKRQFARVDVQFPATFSGESISGGGLVTGLSCKGCTIVSEELLLDGASVAVHIMLPEQYAPLKVDLAEVRWVQGQECGLEFVRLRLEERRRLERVVRALDPRAET